MGQKNQIFQIFRGLCIIAVVFTHVINKNLANPNYEIAMFIQNIINFAVTGFIFLAGYFVNIELVKNNTKLYYSKKINKIIMPYLLWSLFYVCMNIIIWHQEYSLKSLIVIFLMGKASAPLYYFVLYFLFVLITPFIVKRMDNKIWNIIFYACMPLWFIIVYYLQLFKNINYSHWGIVPFSWFLYYYIGIKWRDIKTHYNRITILCLICLGFIFELIESQILFSFYGDTFFAVTPLRFSAIPYVIAIILLLLNLSETSMSKNSSNFLNYIGDNSYGIFLCHMTFLPLLVRVDKYFLVANPYIYILYIFLVLIVTILICNEGIEICKKYIAHKYLQYIGFV